jgi:hypothetical protein
MYVSAVTTMSLGKSVEENGSGYWIRTAKGVKQKANCLAFCSRRAMTLCEAPALPCDQVHISMGVLKLVVYKSVC